jgi:hypothetical protein
MGTEMVKTATYPHVRLPVLKSVPVAKAALQCFFRPQRELLGGHELA